MSNIVLASATMKGAGQMQACDFGCGQAVWVVAAVAAEAGPGHLVMCTDCMARNVIKGVNGG